MQNYFIYGNPAFSPQINEKRVNLLCLAEARTTFCRILIVKGTLKPLTGLTKTDKKRQLFDFCGRQYCLCCLCAILFDGTRRGT
jgi:hypothetical protein